MPASMRRPAPLGCVLEERLLLREAEGDDVAVDRDRPAGDDERLRRRVRAELGDDRRPGRDELVQRGVRGRCRGPRPWLRARHGGRRLRRAPSAVVPGVGLGVVAGAAWAARRASGGDGSVAVARAAAAVGRRRRRVGSAGVARRSRLAWAPRLARALVGADAGDARTGRARGAAPSSVGRGCRWSSAREPVRRAGARACDRGAGGRGEHRELELEAQAADARPVRVDRGQPAARGGQRRGIVASGPRRRRADPTSSARIASTAWSRSARRSRPRFLERVEERDPRGTVAARPGGRRRRRRPRRRRDRAGRGRSPRRSGRGPPRAAGRASTRRRASRRPRAGR